MPTPTAMPISRPAHPPRWPGRTPRRGASSGLLWRAPAPDRAPDREPGAPASTDAQLTPEERAMLDALDAQRRLVLLRIIVPGLFVVALLALPAAVFADLNNHTLNSSAQIGLGLGGFGIALVAVVRRNVNLAALAFWVGLTGVIVMLLLSDSLLRGSLALAIMPEFALLTLPIVLAGILGGPRRAGLTALASAAFTALIFFLTPHAPDLEATFEAGNGTVLLTVPLAGQLALGILTVANARGQRRVQRELVSTRVAYERERELDRMKDQFISSVNHELRTPIMALQSYIELARELGRRGDYARQEHMLRRGEEAAEYLTGLVRSVLNVRKVEADAASMKPAPFALRPVVLSALNLLDPLDAGDVPRDLRLRIPESLAVNADEERVRQVLVNLLSNAAKYSPPGSPIEVAAGVVRADPPRRPSAPSLPTPMVEIVVRDYGMGIPPEQASLLFERFTRLERDIASNIPGTGLGLAICRAYVEAMGGRIWAESSGLVGDGTTFRFTLPYAEAPLAAQV